MLKKYLTVIFVIGVIVFSPVSFGAESGYGISLSRMEREWFNTEYKNDNDITRISRLEEKVFGTIHDVDIETRYKRLQQAFDLKKNKRYKRRNNLYDYPTSLPMNVDDLLGSFGRP